MSADAPQARHPRKPNDVLWERYRAHGDAEARAALLDGYLGLVHHGAREVLRRAPGPLDFEELISAGTVGLVQALEGFDPSRGLAFSTYAMPRIRGAMLDELRHRDWTPRLVRTRRRRLAQERARLQHALGRAPSPSELAEALEIDLATYWRWTEETEGRVMIALDQSVDGSVDASCLYETIPDRESREPGDALARQETLEDMLAAFGELPERERLVLTLYYYEELSLKQIGEVLHVTESRVSQIRTRALQRLRLRVERVGEDT
jgi:RNA polymerase sigma factor for flagellar operon FliA